jgi:hypothetical protein
LETGCYLHAGFAGHQRIIHIEDAKVT